MAEKDISWVSLTSVTDGYIEDDDFANPLYSVDHSYYITNKPKAVKKNSELIGSRNFRFARQTILS